MSLWTSFKNLWSGGSKQYYQSSAGEYVDSGSSKQFTPFYAAVKNLSEDVAKITLMIYKGDEQSGKEEARDHYLYRLLTLRPNPYCTPIVFKQTLIVHAAEEGNGYAEIVRNGYGLPAELYNIEPQRVTQKILDNGELVFVISPSMKRGDRHQTETVIRSRNMIHIVGGLTLDGINGTGALDNGSDSIGLGLAAQKHASKYFKNGGNLGTVIAVHKHIKNTEAWDATRDRVEKEFTGPSSTHRTAVIPAGEMTIQNIGDTASESQLEETRKAQGVDAARLVRMAPHKIGDLSNATYSNIEHQSKEYHSDTIQPWLIRLEQELNYKLLGDEHGEYFIKADVKMLAFADIETRLKYLKTMSGMGALSINGVLGIEGMNKINEEWANAHYMQLNMTTPENIDNGNNLKSENVKKEDK